MQQQQQHGATIDSHKSNTIRMRCDLYCKRFQIKVICVHQTTTMIHPKNGFCDRRVVVHDVKKNTFKKEKNLCVQKKAGIVCTMKHLTLCYFVQSHIICIMLYF